jgi:hypothetical protein
VKKKNLLIAVLSAVLVCVVALLIVPEVQSRLEAGRLTGTLSNLRQLQMALKTYSLGSFSSGDEGRYPRSLQELTKGNYLTKGDLEKLTTSPKVVYTPPRGKGYASDIILTAYTEKGVTTMALDGAVHIESAHR